jgi:hypothetical protein
MSDAPAHEAGKGPIRLKAGEWTAAKPIEEIAEDNLFLMRPIDARSCPPRFIHIWVPDAGSGNVAVHERTWRETDRGWIYAQEVDGPFRSVFNPPLPTNSKAVRSWLTGALSLDYTRARKLLAAYEDQNEALFFATAEELAEALMALEQP